MKKILLIGLILMAFSASAQFKMGVAGGVNIANLGGSDIRGDEHVRGFNGGFIMEVKLPVKLGFEADVLFSTKGAKIAGGADGFKFSYIDMPVVMKIYTAKILSLQLGAQYALLINGKFDGEDFKDELKPTDLSAVLGLGVDALKLHLSARYNYGLTGVFENGSDIKNNMLTFTVGFWIK